ncbi:MAG: hypothetical protein K2J77_00765, partial [Oscillospiraceae bacterium]|nr:hypothetical protein [Oscillospiraceae bacterium]
MVAGTSFGNNNSEVALTKNGVPIPEPISFGFDEIIKAKAEADAEIKAEIERRINERTSLAMRTSSSPETAFVEESPKNGAAMYRYDIAAGSLPNEISDLKRK